MNVKLYFSELSAKEFGYKTQEIIQEDGNKTTIKFTHVLNQKNNYFDFDKVKLAFPDLILKISCQENSLVPNTLKIINNSNNIEFISSQKKSRQQEITENMKTYTPLKNIGAFITVLLENLKLFKKNENTFQARVAKMREYQNSIKTKSKPKI